MQLLNENMTSLEMITVAFGGLIGALAKDCLIDNSLMLPKLKNGKLYLGFIGGALVGAFLGLVIDGSFITATLAGYSGTSILKNVLSQDGFVRDTNIELKKTIAEADKIQRKIEAIQENTAKKECAAIS